MHLVFDLLDDVRRSGRDELHYVRAKLTGGGINNLKFFFYADGEAVSHEVALRDLGCGDAKRVSYRANGEITSLGGWPEGRLAAVSVPRDEQPPIIEQIPHSHFR